MPINSESLAARQLAHTRNLMRNAHNALTGKVGLTDDDIRALASTPELKERYLNRRFGARMDDRSAFDRETGAAKPWANDLAAILDLPVEEVFKFHTIEFTRHARRARVWNNDKWLIDEKYMRASSRLPLQDARPLDDARDIEDPTGIDDVILSHEVQMLISRLLLKISDPVLERVLRARFGIGHLQGRDATLKEMADPLGRVDERIRQRESKAKRTLRYFAERDLKIGFGSANKDRLPLNLWLA